MLAFEEANTATNTNTGKPDENSADNNVTGKSTETQKDADDEFLGGCMRLSRTNHSLRFHLMADLLGDNLALQNRCRSNRGCTN